LRAVSVEDVAQAVRGLMGLDQAPIASTSCITDNHQFSK
jgi:hypothetical protein